MNRLELFFISLLVLTGNAWSFGLPEEDHMAKAIRMAFINGRPANAQELNYKEHTCVSISTKKGSLNHAANPFVYQMVFLNGIFPLIGEIYSKIGADGPLSFRHKFTITTSGSETIGEYVNRKSKVIKNNNSGGFGRRNGGFGRRIKTKVIKEDYHTLSFKKGIVEGVERLIIEDSAVGLKKDPSYPLLPASEFVLNERAGRTVRRYYLCD
jgi:hypothetical protein